MKKIDLLNPEINRIIMECEDRILELIDNRDEFTRSDLQGAAMAIVIAILRTELPD